MNEDEIHKTFASQQAHYKSVGKTSWRQRSALLKELERTILSRRKDITHAIYQDFRKPASEVELSEIFVVLKEIRFARKNLRKWTMDEKVGSHLGLFGTRSWVTKESKGLSLIISPWNFPFNLSLCAIVSAISAGCCVILKPSEYTPHTNEVISQILNHVFETQHVSVVEGNAEVATELLKLPFNHIHFTGSTRVGKIVMRAAAENLSSVTLELGGKSPVVVDKSANILQASKRIAWAKAMNAGQACIAPDFIVVHKDIKDKLITTLEKDFNLMYGSDYKDNIDYCGMVNLAAANRIEDLAASANINSTHAKASETGTPIISPRIVENVPDSSPILKEEIFGPLLPIRVYDSQSSLLSILDENPRPLASYIFSRDKKLNQTIIDNTRSGATCINEIAIQFNNPNLPFGGTNSSGIGKSHGHYGFLEFTNLRAMLKQTFAWNSIHLIVPPYTKMKNIVANIVVKYF